MSIYAEEDSLKLYSTAAKEIIKTIKCNPKAVIVLPTGSTPVKLYKTVVQHFKDNPTFDLSQATFFNLDEYIGLEPGHPLSYAYYMEAYFYGPLRCIDPKRSPAKIYLPNVKPGETPEQAANRYAQMLKEAGEIDLAVVGVGGAYPEEGKLKGGHIAFNEPGTPITQGTHVVTLTDKTRLDTTFRFSSLKSLMASGEIKGSFSTEVPKQAITMGMAEILSAKRIIVLATGEDKAPVVEHALLEKESPDFPASHLQKHKNVHWYVDDAAAPSLFHSDSKTDPRLPLRPSASVASREDDIPMNKKILVLSPHPDDDVICMSATLKKLREKNNIIHIVYAVTGSNAVRSTDTTYLQLYPTLKDQNPNLSESDLVQLTKEKSREVEAINAVGILGIKPEQLTFFKAQYYKRRGIPGLTPLGKDDLDAMVKLLNTVKPDIIFFAAENDPHGAHGLSTQLIAKTVQKTSLRPIFYGYRGAYAEWPLSLGSELMIVPFDEQTMNEKITAIKAHISQLDPLFPSFDPRPFWQRAYDRNKASGQKLYQSYVEIFKFFTYNDFVKHYA